ncbi:hypothetical protein IV102_24115 [bacterium]|nr:hypothetical protein [bacterium]
MVRPDLKQNTPEAFRQQLRSGHYNELRVALYFMLRGHAARLGFDGQSFDITVVPGPDYGSRQPFRVEVKWDKHAARTGNAYFETDNPRSGKATGIRSSSADWWCHVLGEGQEALLMPLPLLRRWLDERNYRSVRTQGSDSNSRGLVVPLTDLDAEKKFLRVHLPTPEEYFDDLLKRALSGP